MARRAPTASNSQKLHWIVVGDRTKVHALSEETMNWMRTSEISQAMLELGDRDTTLYCVQSLWPVLPRIMLGEKHDCTIALTFPELAAEARNLGVCWAGYLTRVAGVHVPLLEALAVPEGYVVHGGLMLGERKYSYRWIPPRKPLSVQWN